MFGEQDHWTSPHVAVISEPLARQRWPNQDPIGLVIEFGNMSFRPQPTSPMGKSDIWCWVRRYAPILNQRIRRELRHPNRSWRVDETYVRVAGNWTNLYRIGQWIRLATPSILFCRPSGI